jgi:Holliday junction resolvase RusA-like endonuclease
VTLVLTLTSQLPGGKNQVQHTKTGRHYADTRFAAWRKEAGTEIVLQRATWPAELKMTLPFRQDLALSVSYRELTKGGAGRDLTGMLDAIFHLLEHCEVIENDRQIKALEWEYPWRTAGPGAVLSLETL